MLVVKEQNKNLGTVSLGKATTFQVDLWNDGIVDIEIEQVKPGCGACTVARVSSAHVPANSTIQLIATFTPRDSGPNYKSITIKYKQAGVIQSVIARFSAEVV